MYFLTSVICDVALLLFIIPQQKCCFVHDLNHTWSIIFIYLLFIPHWRVAQLGKYLNSRLQNLLLPIALLFKHIPTIPDLLKLVNTLELGLWNQHRNKIQIKITLITVKCFTNFSYKWVTPLLYMVVWLLEHLFHRSSTSVYT